MDQGFEDLHTEATPIASLDETVAVPDEAALIAEPIPAGEDIAEQEEAPKEAGFGRFLGDILETLVLAALLFIAINTVSARIRVDGSSMDPTLHNGQFVMVNRWSYKFSSPSHGDIVVFPYPRDPEQEYIKRIIGLPGDSIGITGGKVYVNDQELIEPYIAAPPRSQGVWVIPEGQIFVLGDNRNNSQDSRNFGPVPIDDVIGKAIFIYWPPTDWGLVTSPEIEAAISNP
jgi:signal peptidase I